MDQCTIHSSPFFHLCYKPLSLSNFMYLSLSFYLSLKYTYLSLTLHTSLSLCIPIYLSLQTPIYLSPYTPIYLSLYTLIYLSLYTPILSLYIPISHSIYHLSISNSKYHLSIADFTYLSLILCTYLSHSIFEPLDPYILILTPLKMSPWAILKHQLKQNWHLRKSLRNYGLGLRLFLSPRGHKKNNKNFCLCWNWQKWPAKHSVEKGGSPSLVFKGGDS